ncbi:MAG: hypothetical protein KC503_00420 [Myxococcales bacterium]|nr:hypothetical protein [Myxococcales bacterium]
MSEAVLSSPPPISARRELGAALLYVAHVESLLALGIMGSMATALEWAATLPWTPSMLALGVARLGPQIYLYLTLRKAARGSLRLPERDDYRDSWDMLIVPLLQLVAAGAFYVVSLMALAARALGLSEFFERVHGRPLALLRRPDALLHTALGISVLLLPATLAASCWSPRVAPLFDPSYGLRRIASDAATRESWRRTFALVCVVALTTFAADSVGVWVERALPIPFASDVLHHMLVLGALMAQARLIGGFAARARPDEAAAPR